MADEIHEVEFERNRRDGWFRARCKSRYCFWCRVGPPEDEAAIRAEAATHDLDWVLADDATKQREPA